MRITFVCGEVSQRGGGRVTAEYARRLAAKGHDVTVVARKPKVHSLKKAAFLKVLGKYQHTSTRDRAVYFEPLGDRFHWLPNKWPLEPSDLPEADVLIATWWRTAFEVAMMPPGKGRKFYFIQHHEVHDHLPYDLSSGSYWLPLRKITIADWLVDTMAERYSDHNVAKVPNSVDTRQFDAPARERNEVPRVGFMYAPVHYKGTDICIQAVEAARVRFPALQVTAFGAGDLLEKLPLPKGTEYHKSPPQNSIPKIYASCDLWLFGSRNEGFGLPLLEAMACRTPVVATKAGAAPDLIEPGQNGFLAEIDDAHALGEKLIEALMFTPEEWRSISDSAYAQVRKYTWDDATKAFEAALARE